MPQWTAEQKQAIESRNCNLLVSAAAGSGKTAVLVQRILSLVIKDQIDVDQMLVVTFTNAAASEMKERIGREMLKASQELSNKRLELRRQLSLLNRSYIMTMHSFCLKVLRSHFHLIDLDPSFRVGNETEIALLKQEALDSTLEKFYEEADPSFHLLIESFCDMKNDRWLEYNLSKVHTFIQSQPDPEAWLKDQVQQFDVEPSTIMETRWIKVLFQILQLRFNGMVRQMEMAYDYCQVPDGPEVYMDLIDQEIEALEKLMEKCLQYDEAFFKELWKMDFKRLPAAKNVNSETKALVQGLRNAVKDELKAMKNDWFVGGPDQWSEDLGKMLGPMEKFRELVVAFHHQFSQIKRKKNLVDFNDLEHMALEILNHKEASEYYRNQFQHIFVDEYQDSNRVQEAITDRIKRENNLFMVGDVKQSIYRFRLAEPALFLQKQHNFLNQAGADDRRIDLNRNFRSRNEILKGVNELFKNIMSPALGEMEYGEDAMLLSGGLYPEIEEPVPIELHLLDKRKSEDPSSVNALKEWTDNELEAKLVVGRVQEVLKGEVYDEKLQQKRRVQYRDIVILMRSTRPYLQIYEDMLDREGIPVFSDAGSGFFQTIEVQIFLNLLKIIDNIKQDIPLLSVLRSPIGGFETDELALLRLKGKEAPFYECFMNGEELEDIRIRKKVADFKAKISFWRWSLDIGLSDFIWQIMDESGYYGFVASMPGGEQRQANLRILGKRAEEFETHQEGSLYGFLQYVEKLQKGKGNDLGVAKLIGPNNNVVRIMSIHKSKGLEFPVVILAGAGRKFNLRDTHEKMLVHKDLGIGSVCAEPDKRVFRSTIVRNIIKEKIRQESLSEEMRILYVAMTRAKEKLIMVGSVEDPKLKWTQWEHDLHPYKLSKGQRYLDWIGPSLANAYGILGETNGFWNSQWSLSIWKKEELVTDEKREIQESQKFKNRLRWNLDQLPEKDTIYIKSRLEWEYPFIEETRTQSKYSVSELVDEERIKTTQDQLFRMPVLIKKPDFLCDEKLVSAAEKGTRLHYVIQQLDFVEAAKGMKVQEQLQQMLEKEMITEEEMKGIDPAQISLFLESPLGKRIREADLCRREWPFVVKKQIETGEVVMQGIIDCYFQEGDSLVLVDYKTDEIKGIDPEDWKEKYRRQMNLYEDALKELTGFNIKEKWIYSFFLNKALIL